MRLAELASKRSDLFFLTHADINVEEGFNGRKIFLLIEELAQSIASNGLLQPLRIRRDKDGTIWLVDGERRYRAIGLAISMGLVPANFPIAIVVDTSKDEGERLITQLESNTGMAFTLLEKARLFQRIRATGIDAPEIARRSHTSKQAVYTALLIADKASPHIVNLIETARISATFAADIIGKNKEDHDAQDAAANAALDNAAATGRTTATPKNAKPERTAKPKPAPEPEPASNDEDEDGDEDEDEDKDEEPETDEGEEDDDGPATVVVDTTKAHKDTVNPPPNKQAYESIVNAPSTNRDGTSTSSGPTEFITPDKGLQKLDLLMEKFTFEGDEKNHQRHQDRYQTVEMVIEYLRGTTTNKLMQNWLNVK